MVRKFDLGPESINGNDEIIDIDSDIAAPVDVNPNIDSTSARGNIEQSEFSTSDKLSCCWSSRDSFSYRNEYCSPGSNGAPIKPQDVAPAQISPVPTQRAD